MPTSSGPNTVNDSVIFAYDVADIVNSYKGRPTDNLVANATLNVYNNVTSDVTATITQTSDYYKGAPIWKETITPTTSAGVSYLTNGNNPGIGVYHTGGGGIANRYAGHTIFFKPIGPMYSAPIFTNYSNIVGWQSSQQYDDMGDGWFRAKVLWYDTTTRTDSKYWAINPAGAIIDAPITIYWAGPFKEDLNSQYISQFVNGSRSVTNSLLDLSGRGYSINLTDISFDSNLQIYFDGTNDVIYIPSVNTLGGMANHTWEMMVKSPGLGSGKTIGGLLCPDYGMISYIDGSGNIVYYLYNSDTSSYIFILSTSGVNYFDNKWHHIVCSRQNYGTGRIYVDGQLKVESGNTGGWSGTTIWSNMSTSIGNNPNDAYYNLNGSIAITKIYNRALTIDEVKNNYSQYKSRFNLS
jgi:hypothetical protein